MGCQESRAGNLLEIRIFRFHVIKVVFKETYQFMRATTEKRAPRKWEIFPLAAAKVRAFNQVVPDFAAVTMNTSSSSAWKCF